MADKEKKLDMNEENELIKSKPKIDGFDIMMWTALGGIIASVIAAAIDKRLTVGIIGAVIFICGVVAIPTVKITRKSFGIVFLPVIGLPAAAVPIYSMLSEHDPIKFPPPSYELRLIAFGALALVMGLSIAVSAAATRGRLKKCCTLEVESVFARVSEGSARRSGIRYYVSVWEYYVNGQTYTYTQAFHLMKNTPEAGDRKTLMINPADPNEVYLREATGYPTLVIVGICFVIAGIMMIALS